MSLSPLNSSHRLSLYTSSRRSVQSSLFHHQIPPVFPEELTLPRSACCALSRLRCNGHSTLLGIYLHRLGRAETPSCSNCGSESQDLSHLVLDCPVLDQMRRAIFSHTISILELWSTPWRVARLLGLRGVVRAPSPEMGRVNPTPPLPQYHMLTRTNQNALLNHEQVIFLRLIQDVASKDKFKTTSDINSHYLFITALKKQHKKTAN